MTGKVKAQNYTDPNNLMGNPQNPNNLPQSQTLQDTSNVEEDTVKAPKEKFTWKNNPLVASLASTIIPGAGQIYNKKLWKVPIVWGVMGTMGYLIIDNNIRYNDFKRAFIYLQKRNPDNYDQAPYDSATAAGFFNQIYQKRQNEMLPFDGDSARNKRILQFRRDDARRTRDWITVFFLLAYVLNIMDASVDAHFATFDVSDKLSMKIGPSFLTDRGLPQAGLNMTLSFNDPRRKNKNRMLK